MRIASLIPFLTLGLSAQAAVLSTTRSLDLDVDVCAAVDAKINLPPIINSPIQACICVSTIDGYIEANAVVKAAATILGRSRIRSYIEALINSSRGRCYTPEHAIPICSSSCDFTCKPPFVKDGRGCKCPPNRCGSKCDRACPTNRPKAKRHPTSCPPNHSVCGVFGGGKRSWECVNTQSDLESCGGCAIPFAFDPNPRGGTDCSTILNIADVACVSGFCDVRRCKKGWKPSKDRRSCELIDVDADLDLDIDVLNKRSPRGRHHPVNVFAELTSDTTASLGRHADVVVDAVADAVVDAKLDTRGWHHDHLDLDLDLDAKADAIAKVDHI